MQYIGDVINELIEKHSKPLQHEINIVEEIFSIYPHFKRKIISKGIREGSLKVNKKITTSEIIQVSNFDIVEFMGERIKIFKKHTNILDQFVQITLKKISSKNNLLDLSIDQKNKFIAYFIEYWSLANATTYQLEQSTLQGNILEILKDFYKTYLANSLDKRIPDSKELIDKIVQAREELYSQFQKVITSLKNDLYDSEFNKLFKELRPIFLNPLFGLLVQPITETDIDYFILVQKTVNLYKKVERENDPTEKIKRYVESNREYDLILKNQFCGKDKISNQVKALIEYFKDKAIALTGLSKNENAELHLIQEIRTYNFENNSLLIHGYIINKGKGFAKNVKVIQHRFQYFEIAEVIVADIIMPASKYKIKFQIDFFKLPSPTIQKVDFTVVLQWLSEDDKPHQTKPIQAHIERQQKDLPWDEIRSTSPYDLRKIDDPNKLFGRDKLIDDFKFAIEKNFSIGSYVIHGQKRVGKSSIVKTLESYYNENRNVHFVYTEVTERKGNDALYTFNEIGKHLAKQLIRDFEKKNPNYQGKIQLPSFNGSLSPLIDIVDEINSYNPLARIILSLDEFDELNEEFFENSNIGNVFASNIGKGLSAKRFVGVILIGSENTENKTKRGMRLLNAVKFLPIDSFQKVEFEEYCKIIKKPTLGLLTFSPEVLEIIFEYSNGNPFYTNLICDKIFNTAYEKKIPYIDQDFLEPILNDIQISLSTKDFIHFWEDGATDDTYTNKKTFSKRCHILIAYAKAKKEDEVITWDNLQRKIRKVQDEVTITSNQFHETFNEFIHRKIFYLSDNNSVTVKPKIFESWLLHEGLFQIASQLEDKEGLLDQLQEDEKLKLSNDQLSNLCNNLFGSDNKTEMNILKKFFEQFENNKEKTLIADLLKQMKILKSQELIAFLKKAYSQIWSSISLEVGELNYRKDVEIICLKNSFKQNETFYENIMVPQLHLHPTRKLKTKDELAKLDDHVNNIIIYEPLIDCPYYYRNEISKILKSINPINVTHLKIYVLGFIISHEAKQEIENLLSNSFNFDFQILALKEFERIEISPYFNKLSGGINDPTIKCLTKIYGNINEDSCLVKIGEIVPYQCYPFLWCDIPTFKSIFQTQYTFEDYLKRFSLSDRLKDYNIKSESKKIELKATMAIPAVNWKKIKELSKKIVGKTNQVKSSFIENTQNEIQKLWKLNLTTKEQSDVSNTVKYSLAKNLSAFANTEGGEIYIGIEDDFTIIGTQEGNTDEESKRIFTEIVKKYIGLEFIEYFSIQSVKISETEKLLRIEVKECKTDVWIKCNEEGNKVNDGEQIFIRTEFGTEKLSPKTYADWRNHRNVKYRISE